MNRYIKAPLSTFAGLLLASIAALDAFGASSIVAAWRAESQQRPAPAEVSGLGVSKESYMERGPGLLAVISPGFFDSAHWTSQTNSSLDDYISFVFRLPAGRVVNLTEMKACLSNFGADGNVGARLVELRWGPKFSPGVANAVTDKPRVLSFPLDCVISNNTELRLYGYNAVCQSEFSLLGFGNDPSLTFADRAMAVCFLGVQPEPVVVLQPQGGVRSEGDRFTFSVSVEGAEPNTYQWYRNGTGLTGATGRSLVIESLSPSHAGDYCVWVTNRFGWTKSQSASLAVSMTRITSQPLGGTLVQGSNFKFSVTAEGFNPLAYQWYKNGIRIAGATQESLTLTNLTESDTGNYLVSVTNLARQLWSQPAALTVLPKVRYVGTDMNTAERWRTRKTAKFLDADGDNIYGTDGWIVYSYWEPGYQPWYDILTTAFEDPDYIEAFTDPVRGWGGGNDGNFGWIDDPLETGASHMATHGHAPNGTHLELDLQARPNRPFRLGVMVGNDGQGFNQDIEVRVGTQTARARHVGPVGNKAAQYHFFDIASPQGSIRVVVNNNSRDNPGIMGFTFDSLKAVADAGADYRDDVPKAGWNYLQSNEPTGGDESPLTFGGAVGTLQNRGYGGGANVDNLPCVLGRATSGNFQLFQDGANDGVPGTDLLLHPGDNSNMPPFSMQPYVIVRYTISTNDTRIGSQASIVGSFRRPNSDSDGVEVYVFHNNTELFSRISSGSLREPDGTFNLSAAVSAGDSISFVLGKHHYLYGDETALRSRIVLAPGVTVNAKLELKLDNGQAVITLSGPSGVGFRLQRTPALVPPSWTEIETKTADSTGRAFFTDTHPPSGGAFYRAVTRLNP